MGLSYICGNQVFGYSSYDGLLDPVSSKLDKNLKGLELEVDNISTWHYDYGTDIDDDDEIYFAFEDLIGDGTLLTRNTIDKAKRDYNAVVSYDSTVNYEIGLQANQERNIMKKVQKIGNGIGDLLDNSTETSCHIHCNLEYIENQGSNLLEMQRATEFLVGLLYRISGRDTRGYGWCKSRYDNYYGGHSSLNKTMLEMAKYSDRMDYGDYDTHELACNGQHDNTVELRIFSNRFNFDYDMIKTYIEFTDFIIDLSTYMYDKSYVDEFDSLYDWTVDFCNGTRRRRNSLKPFHLDTYLVSRADMRLVEFNNEWNKIFEEFENMKDYLQYRNADEQVREVLRFTRRHNISLDTQLQFATDMYFYKINLNAIEKELNNQYTIQKNNL